MGTGFGIERLRPRVWGFRVEVKALRLRVEVKGLRLRGYGRGSGV